MTIRIHSLVLLATLMASGCDKGGDDSPATEEPAGPTASAPETPITPSGSDRSSAGECAMIERMSLDGRATPHHVSGNDDMALDVRDGQVGLRVGTSQQGSTNVVELRGAYGEATIEGTSTRACIARTGIVFAHARGTTPAQGVETAYSWTGDAGGSDLDASNRVRWYIDVNEDMSMVQTGAPTIEYSGTSGTFTFTKLNGTCEDPADSCHTVRFDILFTKVIDGSPDDSVQTRLAGEVSYSTLSEL